MEINIRPAEIRDGGYIYLLNLKALGYDFPEDKTIERLSDIVNNTNDAIFVAEYQDKVIGYIHGSSYHCTYSPPIMNLMVLAVDKSMRKQHVGTMLLERFEEWAKENGAAGIRLTSGFNRIEAHVFYTKNGYMHRKDAKNFIKNF